MEALFQPLLERIYIEATAIAKQLEVLDETLASTERCGSTSDLQMIDRLRQEAFGLAEFTSSLYRMLAETGTIDINHATEKLRLSAQKARLSGALPPSSAMQPELW